MRVLVTGATGFVGRRLLAELHSPVVLSRDVQRAQSSLAEFDVSAFPWDAQHEPAPEAAFASGVDAVIHLAGDPVAHGRWWKSKKDRIRESRVAGTRHLVETLSRLTQKPKVLVSASAIGYYGSRGDEILDENAEPGDDFLAEVCQAWEAEAVKAREAGIRVALIRVGIVLGRGGGALSKMLGPFRWGVGGRLGNGRQWMSWIHIDDLVKMILMAVERDALSGPINGTAPNPVTNREFTKTLGRVLWRPTIFPVPGFMLRLMLGQFANVLLGSQRVIPKAALDAGFQFQFPDLEAALRDVLDRKESSAA